MYYSELLSCELARSVSSGAGLSGSGQVEGLAASAAESVGLHALDLVESGVDGQSAVAGVHLHLVVLLSELLKVGSGSLTQLVELSLHLQSLELSGVRQLEGADHAGASGSGPLGAVVTLALRALLLLLLVVLGASLAEAGAQVVHRSLTKSAASSSGDLALIVVVIILSLDWASAIVDSSVLKSVLADGLGPLVHALHSELKQHFLEFIRLQQCILSLTKLRKIFVFNEFNFHLQVSSWVCCRWGLGFLGCRCLSGFSLWSRLERHLCGRRCSS